MRAATLYQALLRCYPTAFRDEYGAQMVHMFSQQMGEARSLWSRTALWLHAAADALTIAPQEHCHVISQDARYALRTMKAQPGFTAVAVLSLALGIGANTAIFSLWNGVLHSNLPGVQHPEQLAILTDPASSGAWNGDIRGVRDWLTYPEFQQLNQSTTSFSEMMASDSRLDTWQVRFDGREAEDARGRLVTGGYFNLLGIRPALGHFFSPADERAASPYAVISYNYWQRRFGGRADVLGKTFTLRNAVLTIIGVAPSGFLGETAGEDPDAWMPVTLQPRIAPGEDWLHDQPPVKRMWLHAFGRLKPGVTLAHAQAESNAIFKADLETFYGALAATPERRSRFLDQRLELHPGAIGASAARGDFSTSLTALLAAVGLLLLIACANLANLLLARGAARKPEMALRISLGAGRGRLIRQLVTESLVLAAFGGIAGLAIGALVHGVLVRMITQSSPDFRMTFGLDPLVLAFAVTVTLAAGLLFGLLPAWQASRSDASTSLNERGRGAGSFGRMRLGRSLVSVQLALSLPLLAGAGLLARTLYNLQHVALGYSTQGLSLVGINSRISGYDSAHSAVLFHDLLAEVRQIPGVTAATYSHNGVFTGSNSGDGIEVEGFTPKTDDDKSSAWEMVGPGYFSTLGDPILLGRDILDTDQAGSPKVCVVNQAFATHYFEGRNPLGLHLTAVDETPTGTVRTTYQIVGVAKDVRTRGLRDTAIDPIFYEPITQHHGDNVKRANFLIRTAAANTSVLGAVQAVFRRVAPTVRIQYARTFDEQIAPRTATERTTAQVAIVFGCVALVLAAIGLYGVLSYGIARRKGEIAIRIALGARPSRVISMVLRETATLIVAGLALGAAFTYAATRWLSSQLFGVAPQDPIVLSLAIAVLLLVAIVAALLPAHRASRVDPMASLRM